MILFAMSDEPTTNAGRTMHFVFQYVCGFPLVLLHPNLPFFIESQNFVWSSIPLTVLNAVIQVGLIGALYRLSKQIGIPR